MAGSAKPGVGADMALSDTLSDAIASVRSSVASQPSMYEPFEPEITEALMAMDRARRLLDALPDPTGPYASAYEAAYGRVDRSRPDD